VIGHRAGKAEQFVLPRMLTSVRDECRDPSVVDGPEVLPPHDILAGRSSPPILQTESGVPSQQFATTNVRPRLECGHPARTVARKYLCDAKAIDVTNTSPRWVLSRVGIDTRNVPSEYRATAVAAGRRPAMPQTADEITHRGVELVRAVDDPRRLHHGDRARTSAAAGAPDRSRKCP